MNTIVLVFVWNFIMIPYFVYLLVQELFPDIPQDWSTFGIIFLLILLIRGTLDLKVILK